MNKTLYRIYTLLCFILAGVMAAEASAQDMSGWSDKTLCRLAKTTPDNIYYQAESTRRGLSCGGAGTQTNNPSSQNIDRTVSGIDKSNKIQEFKDSPYELPDNLDYQPNDATIAHYYVKNDSNRSHANNAYKIQPASTFYKFNRNIERNKDIELEMNTKTILSYLYFEDGEIIYDEVAPSERFNMVFDDKSYFSSHSMGKSITSYLIGHAICEGYIESIDTPINDWPLMSKTLYFGQPIINLLNMKAGDSNVVEDMGIRFTKTGRHIHALDPLIRATQDINELKNSKPIKNAKFKYSNLTADILFNYIMHRVGSDFEPFIQNFYQTKVRIQNPVYLETNRIGGRSWSLINPSMQERIDQGAGRYGISATRYDYLRIAKLMVDDWQGDTCEGRYLKEIYNRRVPTNRRISSWNSADLKWGNPTFGHTAKTYAGQFWTDFYGLNDQKIMVMLGYNGQVIAMDMDNSRIIVINAAKSRHYDTAKLGYIPLKYGRIK